MNIRLAEAKDIDRISAYDTHISREELDRIISLQRVYIAEENDRFLGWLRYNLFWDTVPFLNMLYITEGDRKKGIGRKLMDCWEHDMKQSGYDLLMTSTQSEEFAQHFYYQLGYKTIGGFLLTDEPYEILLSKNI